MGRIGISKSAGCRTCRRRKVKCDERRPTCEKCAKGEFQCEGYARDLRFVDENSRTERHAKRAAAKSSPVVLKTFKSPCSEEARNEVGFGGSFIRSPRICSTGEDLHIPFLLMNLFSGFPPIESSPWLRLHAEDPSPSAHMSVRALGAVFFGRKHHLDEVVKYGTALYGKALKYLNRDLQDSTVAGSMPVLKTAIALEIFEFIAFNSGSGWMKHAGGVGRLIELRGPWRHQSPIERQVLEGNRVTIALECWVNKRRCFLEHPDWKNIPWAKDPDSKTLNHYLHDILCDMPGLLEDTLNLENSEIISQDYISRHEALSRNILIQLRTLYEWRVTWQEENSNLCYEIPASGARGQPIFHTVFHYSNLTSANGIAMYNAILLFLLRLGNRVIGTSFDPSIPALHLSNDTSYDPLLPPGSVQNPRDAALEICRSVDYHLLDSAGNAGAFFLLFPLRLAYLTMDPGSREALWLINVMRQLADTSGFEISRNLAGEDVVSTE